MGIRASPEIRSLEGRSLINYDTSDNRERALIRERRKLGDFIRARPIESRSFAAWTPVGTPEYRFTVQTESNCEAYDPHCCTFDCYRRRFLPHDHLNTRAFEGKPVENAEVSP